MLAVERVSVIVPSYNPGTFLRDCVASIGEYSAGVDVEIIVVDDGSTDETTIQVVNELSERPNLKVIRFENNRGVQAARNAGLQAATGDYMVCIDGDDVLLPIEGHPSFLFAATQILANNQDVAFVHTMVRMFGDFEGLTISSYPLREKFVTRKHHVPIAIVYRRSEVVQGLHYIESVPKWQDWAYGVSLLARRWQRKERSEIAFVSGPGYGYRIHSVTARISRTEALEYNATRIIVEAYRDYFVAHYPEIANDIDTLTETVVSSKPSALDDLLHVAAYDLKQALSMAHGREYQLQSASVNRLGIP